MRKCIKKLVLCCMFVVAIMLFCGVSKAATLKLDYNNKEALRTENLKVYAGDEIYVTVAVEETGFTGRVMAIYGKIDYDRDVLELVEAGEGIENNNPVLGEKWSAGSVNDKDNTFFFYTTEDGRSNTVGFIKFKVKSDIDKSITTKVSAKDVSLYTMVNSSNYEEVPAGAKDIDVEIKINKKVDVSIIILVFVMTVVGICIVVLSIRIISMDREDKKAEEAESKDKKVEKAEKVSKRKSDKKKDKEDSEKQDSEVSKEDVEETSKEIKEEPKEEIAEISNEEKEENANRKDDIAAKLEKLAIAKEKFEKVTAKAEDSKETEEEKEDAKNVEEAEIATDDENSKEDKKEETKKNSKTKSSSKKSTSKKSTTKKK